MAGLGIFLYGLMQTIGFVGRTVENEQEKNRTRHIDENGNEVCYGRKSEHYVNGEKTYTRTVKDKYGNMHRLTVGINSEKIYSDSFDKTMQRMNKYSEENKERSLKYGDKAYNRYDPRFQRYVTTEIETGKVIACLYKGTNPETHKQEYRKFYLDSASVRYNFDYDMTAMGDYGIVISEEEYEKLNIIGATFSHIPKDYDVLHKLWGDT